MSQHIPTIQQLYLIKSTYLHGHTELQGRWEMWSLRWTHFHSQS
jgi:hypothetical protein